MNGYFEDSTNKEKKYNWLVYKLNKKLGLTHSYTSILYFGISFSTSKIVTWSEHKTTPPTPPKIRLYKNKQMNNIQTTKTQIKPLGPFKTNQEKEIICTLFNNVM